jgi:hypothetical protein
LSLVLLSKLNENIEFRSKRSMKENYNEYAF